MADDTRRVLVWDIFVRIVHWSLVILMPLAWWTYEIDDMALHRLIGYAILSLLVFRLFWGFAGSEPARFANYLRGPRQIAGPAKMQHLELFCLYPSRGIFILFDGKRSIVEEQHAAQQGHG